MKVKSTVSGITKAAACAILASLTGCASIVSGTSQVVSVETIASAGKVDGASCKLQNDKGVYYVTTPGTVTVRRSYNDMSVQCEKPGHPVGIASIKSTTKGMVAGNIIFGGIIGVGVDAASGAAFDYPVVFQIRLNDSVQNSLLPQPVASGAVSGAMQ